MTEDLTEQQQIEQLAQWWKKHGTMTIMIFIVVIAASIGWRFWLHHREDKLQRGSTHYEELLNAVVNEDEANALKEANLLKSNYRYTPYAAMATLMIARYDIHQNHYDKAKTQLEWVMKHASTSSLKEVARLRYARILNQENHPADALKLLKKINDKDYLPMAEELRGDSYMLLKQEDNARTAYRQAVEGAPYYAAMRPILMMKLDNLAPGSTEQ